VSPADPTLFSIRGFHIKGVTPHLEHFAYPH
jgi:hypothetical protein